jgi:hypothetical protein
MPQKCAVGTAKSLNHHAGNFLNRAGNPRQNPVLERMARPVGKRFFEGGMMVCINVSDLKADALAKMDIRAGWSS